MTELPIIRCNFGMRGYGKTTLARAMVRPRERLLAHDQRRDHEVLLLEIAEFEDYIDASSLEKFRVGMVTTGAEETFCAIAWEIGERIGKENELSATVLLEEADLIARPGQEPEILRRLAAQGRHLGLELVACSRRPAEVSRHLTGNADELNIFRTQEPRDLAYYRQFIPADAVDAVSALHKFQYVHWTLEAWEVRELTDKRGAWRQLGVGGGGTQKNLEDFPLS